MSSLTPKQAAFVREYLIDLNATQAAIRAKYSPRTAASIGEENLRKPEIADAIQKAMESRSKRTEITADRVLQELAKIGFSDVRKIFTETGGLHNPRDMDDDMAAAVQSVEVVVRQVPGEAHSEVEHVHKIKLNDKLGALTQIGRHLGMFTDKVAHEGGMTVVLNGPDAEL